MALMRNHPEAPATGSRYGSRRGMMAALLAAVVSVAGLAGAGGYSLGKELSSQEAAQRLAQMEGEVQRLNALGARLVEIAHLDPDSFDFTQPVPRGGPEEYDFHRPNFSRTDTGDLVRDVDALSRLIEDRGRQLNILESLLKGQDFGEQRLLAGSPVPSGWLSSTFGPRRDPVHGRRAFHQGIDLVAKAGTEVLAVADGIVEYSGWRNGYGRTIDIRHPGGLVTRYAHNRALLVEVGSAVRQGQGIATVGASGRATGTHLHFEVLKDGAQVDPLQYVQLGLPADGES